MTVNGPDQRGRQGPSPLEGERIRPLSRWQIEDRLRELGDLYAQTSGGGPRAWNQDRELFLRRLAVEVQRPGFALLVAERGVLREAAGVDVVLTGCAYGFPIRAHGPWWRGLDRYLPRDLRSLAACGRLFAIAGLVVHSEVRTQNQARAWNLARRLQRRLLADHSAGLTDHPAVLGVMLVDRRDTVTLRALRSWGWRPVAADSKDAPGSTRCRALVVGP
ncbi:hypothetical protein [Streptomyces sp. UG1]|uniref:hypothetical protein n=1 Tax=Streptomyces sp. UG1 TaxID=3417652 RepID=UPI003CEC1AAC